MCITNDVCVVMPQQALNRSSWSHMFFKIEALKNFATFSRKHLCWRLFLIKSQVWWPEILLKRSTHTHVPCEYFEIFKNIFFAKHLRENVNECNKNFYPFHVKLWKVVKHTLKILQWEHCKIFKVCSNIFHHYSWMG